MIITMEEYILNSNYILQTVGEDTVLLPCGTENEVDLSKMIVLNETGSLIMSCIENDYVSFDKLTKYVEESFEDIPETYKKDLKSFIEQLVDKRIITKK